MKLALVYDRVNKFGGAEQVLNALHLIWPQAPLYTTVYNQKTSSWAKTFEIKPSFLQQFPFAKTHHELYPMLAPMAFESFNFDDFDVVISVTSAEAKAIITKPHTLHLSYCLTPTRYLWSHRHQYLNQPGLGVLSKLGQAVFKISYPYLKSLDSLASTRPDHYLAISTTVQKRIKQYYQRDADIIFPPVNTTNFSYKPSQGYFLLVSRLVPYKQVDLAIKAFNQLGQRLVIVGSGRYHSPLTKLARSSIEFKGQVSDQALVKLYQNCEALIMPQEEDFGIVAVEAQATGKPVIAYNSGGALDTIIANQTGLFFNKPTVDSLSKAVKQFSLHKWNHQQIQTHARQFDIKYFKQKFKTCTEAQWLKHQKKLKY
jgi:glycosyltransferase involved in cell wall biosynthesis